MKMVPIETDNGHALCALMEPTAPNGALEPGLIVVHEWWGLNEPILEISRRFCNEGFAVLAVDLFGGQLTSDPVFARKLASETKTMDAMQIIEGGAKLLKQRARSNGKVGVTGFCFGGAMTLAAACHCPNAKAFMPFYGVPLAKHVDWSATQGAIQGHYAEHDRIVDLARVRSIADEVNQKGGSFELHVYDAGHAFMRVDDPKDYNAEAATLAFERGVAFLRRHLS